MVEVLLVGVMCPKGKPFRFVTALNFDMMDLSCQCHSDYVGDKSNKESNARNREPGRVGNARFQELQQSDCQAQRGRRQSDQRSVEHLCVLDLTIEEEFSLVAVSLVATLFFNCSSGSFCLVFASSHGGFLYQVSV